MYMRRTVAALGDGARADERERRRAPPPRVQFAKKFIDNQPTGPNPLYHRDDSVDRPRV